MPEVHKKEAEKKRSDVGDVVVATVKKLAKEGFSGSVWRSLCALPPKTSFESQHEEEQVLLLMRRHPVTNLGWLLLASVLLFVPSIWGEFPLIINLKPMTVLVLAIFWYMALAFFVIQNLLLWFYNVYIVTDERVIDVDFFGLLHKNVNATQIRKVEDVNYSQTGMMSSIFNFGNVIVQTAAEQLSEDRELEASAFTFGAVENPDQVVKVISELMEQEEKEEYEGRTR